MKTYVNPRPIVLVEYFMNAGIENFGKCFWLVMEAQTDDYLTKEPRNAEFEI